MGGLCTIVIIIIEVNGYTSNEMEYGRTQIILRKVSRFHPKGLRLRESYVLWVEYNNQINSPVPKAPKITSTSIIEREVSASRKQIRLDLEYQRAVMSRTSIYNISPISPLSPDLSNLYFFTASPKVCSLEPRFHFILRERSKDLTSITSRTGHIPLIFVLEIS